MQIHLRRFIDWTDYFIDWTDYFIDWTDYFIDWTDYFPIELKFTSRLLEHLNKHKFNHVNMNLLKYIL